MEKKIQMVDLKGQYQHIKPEIEIAIKECLDEANFINGPQVRTFAQELAKYLGCKHVIPCANGTDALQIAFMALGLRPGDEVIIPTFTYVATAEVIALLGLTPVMTDIDSFTFNITPQQIERLITPKTKAIVPVHLFGQSCDMEPILELAEKYGLYVIEDNAQAIGAEYTFRDGTKKKTGTIGHIGTTSFFPSKNLGCYGDGGAISTDNQQLAERMAMIANHGQREKYYHEIIGINSRLDTIQAAILSVKLKNLTQYIMSRQKAAYAYRMALSDCDHLILPQTGKFTTHVYHQFTLQIEKGYRDQLKTYLADNNIPSMVYYPLPLHLQKAYSSYNASSMSFPTAEEASNKVLSLPMHTELTEQDINYISSLILTFFKERLSNNSC